MKKRKMVDITRVNDTFIDDKGNIIYKIVDGKIYEKKNGDKFVKLEVLKELKTK